MASRPCNVLRVVSRKQLHHPDQLTRFIWLRAYRAARVWRVLNNRPSKHVRGDQTEALDAILDLCKISDREFSDVFRVLLTAIDGSPYHGCFVPTYDHHKQR